MNPVRSLMKRKELNQPPNESPSASLTSSTIRKASLKQESAGWALFPHRPRVLATAAQRYERRRNRRPSAARARAAAVGGRARTVRADAGLAGVRADRRAYVRSIPWECCPSRAAADRRICLSRLHRRLPAAGAGRRATRSLRCGRRRARPLREVRAAAPTASTHGFGHCAEGATSAGPDGRRSPASAQPARTVLGWLQAPAGYSAKQESDAAYFLSMLQSVFSQPLVASSYSTAFLTASRAFSTFPGSI